MNGGWSSAGSGGAHRAPHRHAWTGRALVALSLTFVLAVLLLF